MNELENQRVSLSLHVDHHFFKKMKQINTEKTQQMEEMSKALKSKDEQMTKQEKEMLSIQKKNWRNK